VAIEHSPTPNQNKHLVILNTEQVQSVVQVSDRLCDTPSNDHCAVSPVLNNWGEGVFVADEPDESKTGEDLHGCSEDGGADETDE
jgi:hypothetical protein